VCLSNHPGVILLTDASVYVLPTLRFALDHVHLLSDKQLEGFDGLETVWDNRFRGAIPFMPFFQPYHGVYIMRKAGK
jgi:hypothetical protein